MTRLDHKALNIPLPEGFSLELKKEEVLLRRSDGKIIDAILYGELAKRRGELKRLAYLYQN